MKKAMKKLMAALLAVAMVCAMAIPAWADEGANTLTINGTTEGHTYEAYQVFTGKLIGNVLSDIVWGDGVDGNAILNDSELPASLSGTTTAAALAAELEKLAPGSDDVNTFAKVVSKHIKGTAKHTSTAAGKTYTISNLPDGYYFIKDATDTMPVGATYSRYMLNIVKSVTINAKDTSVTLDKQIKHNDTGEWGVVGDNQIGDTVEFRTITTVPDVTGYSTYTYAIHDTMSAGLTSNVKSKADITIKVDNGTELDKSYYSVTADGNTFTVSVDIIAATNANVIEDGDSLYTYYTGVLNENAKIYDKGCEDNEAYLEYSNNPNSDSKGETPKKKVYDWTFKVDVTKIDGADDTKKLEGAVFVLSDTNNLVLNPNAAGIPTNDTDKLIKLVQNSDGSYKVADASSTTTTYTMTTPENGMISIKGLDDHKDYYLYETKAPDGYNSLTAPVKFKVNQLTNNNYDTAGNAINAAPTVKVNGVDSSSVAFDVENNRGTTLPGTGGIGTTIFYVVGGGLMVAAAILLITKKRMENR